MVDSSSVVMPKIATPTGKRSPAGEWNTAGINLPWRLRGPGSGRQTAPVSCAMFLRRGQLGVNRADVSRSLDPQR